MEFLRFQNTEEGAAECICVELCNQEVDPRRKVCTNYNETFGSDCEVYQARCFCDTGDARCRGPDYQHVHIEYYGECRQMPVSIISLQVWRFSYRYTTNNKWETKTSIILIFWKNIYTGF